MLRQRGFIMLELLLAIFLLQIGLVGASQLMLESLATQRNLQRSLEALQLLRQEMEKLERVDFGELTSQPRREIKPGFFYTLTVKGIDEGIVKNIDYKVVRGEISWQKNFQTETSYQLLTYFSE